MLSAPSSLMRASPWQPRYAMIEGWRALAALGVMFDHLGVSPGFDLGHVSVLLFFVISGYCISASADSCERHEIGIRGYMLRRLKRIYPPYLFAVALFVASRLAKAALGGAQQLPADPIVWLQNLTLTQWLTLLTEPRSHAFENPSLFVAGFWSLNYEEQFYLVMGAIFLAGGMLGKSRLKPIMVLLGIGLAWNVLFPSTSFGFFIEYWVSFAVGALAFFRLCKLDDPRQRLALDFCLWAIFGAGLWLSLTRGFDSRLAFNEWTVTAGFALLLVYARRLDDIYKASVVGFVLGALSLASYSLYLTHQMNITSSQAFANMLISNGLPSAVNLPLRALFMCGFAAVFWYFCERPFVNRPIVEGRSPAESLFAKSIGRLAGVFRPAKRPQRSEDQPSDSPADT